MTKSSAIKWHGGKSYLADWIIGHFPPRCKNPGQPDPKDRGWLHYVEPYVGGAAVLLALSPEGISEVVNDINFDLTTFWGVLQSETEFMEFQRIIAATPFAETSFDAAEYWLKHPPDDDPAGTAAAFFTLCRQSMSGRMQDFAPLSRNRTRKGMNEQVAAWLSAIDGLPEVHARLRRVAILNRPAVEVIRSQDGFRTLFYLDPPYLHSTRSTTAEYGPHEMTEEQHVEMLELLATIEGRFLLSGYPSPLYEKYRKKHKWKVSAKMIDNKSSKAEAKEQKTEYLWKNF